MRYGGSCKGQAELRRSLPGRETEGNGNAEQGKSSFTFTLQFASSHVLQYAHIGGEISSHQEQLKMTEKDLRDFKDINKRYTDQLVKVKV